MNSREKGTVKWFNESKGYGFIQRDEGEDVFVHYTGISNTSGGAWRTLAEGQRVEFVVEESERGLQAKEVQVVNPTTDFSW